MEYRVKGSASNLEKATVSYKCTSCRVGLNSPLTDAGGIEKCPECGTELEVPGESEYKHLLIQKQTIENYEQSRAEVENDRSLKEQEAHKAQLMEDQAKAVNKAEQQRHTQELGSSNQRRKSNVSASGILAVAALCIMLGGVLSNPILDRGYMVGSRFKEDFAPGATANAVELLVHKSAANHAEL